MHERSLVGLALLVLSTSCVPPLVTSGSTRIAASFQRPMLPPLTRPVEIALAEPRATALLVPATLVTQPSLSPTSAPPFVSVAQGNDADRALDCLTAAVYYEARSEPVDGQRAVAQVVLNRVRNPAFPNSVCGVVYQGSTRSTGCQFSFTCDGSMLFRREPEAWDHARQVAEAALSGSVYDPVGSATFYHTTAIQPWWASSLARVATIGAHIFYGLGGRIQNALAFHQSYSGVEQAHVAVAETVLSGAVSGTSRLPTALVSGVAVHRGGVSLASARDATASGVHVFFGTTATPEEDGESPSSGVTIHVGDAPDSAGPA